MLTAAFAFAAIWADLCRIAGEPLPRDVAACHDQPLGFVPVSVPSLLPSNDAPVYAD